MRGRIIIGIILAAFIVLVGGNTAFCQKKKKGQAVPIALQAPCIHPNNIIDGKVEFPKRDLKLYDTISITFIGDVMQHGKQLQSALKEGADPYNPKSYDYSHTFRHIEKKLKKADLAVANMEFPLGTPPYTGYPVFSAPESVAWQAKESGIDLFLLANNHIVDKGKRGLLNTLDTYEKMGGRYIGAYRNSNQEQMLNPAFFNIKGIRVAIINFTYGTNGFPVPDPCVVNLMDSTNVKKTILKARQMGADMVICTPHWGEEYSLHPSGHQKKWAKMLLREGVKVIIGGHPHVPQSAESDNDHILFYSLGNYISNQTTPSYTQLELMVTVKIRKNFFTGETELLKPEYELLWCFKKGEFAEDYTVVPIKDILGKDELVKDKYQYRRMEETYKNFIRGNLIEIY